MYSPIMRFSLDLQHLVEATNRDGPSPSLLKIYSAAGGMWPSQSMESGESGNLGLRAQVKNEKSGNLVCL